MTRIKGPLFSLSAHGTIKKTITFRTGRQGARAQQYQHKHYDATDAQLEQRGAYKDACDAWHTLTTDEKQQFRIDAQPLKISGFNLYIKTILNTPPSGPSIYAVWDPTHMDSQGVLDEDQTTFYTNTSGGGWRGVRGTVGLSTGKYCYETAGDATLFSNGFASETWTYQHAQVGTSAISAGLDTDNNYQRSNVTGTDADITDPIANILWVLDLDAGRGWIRDGTGYASGDPETNSAPSFIWTPGTKIYPAGSLYQNDGSIVLYAEPGELNNTVPSGWTAGWYD